MFLNSALSGRPSDARWAGGTVRDLTSWGLPGWRTWDISRKGGRERILLDPQDRLQTSVVFDVHGGSPGFQYARLLSDIALKPPVPGNLLILGGGGGAIHSYLSRKLPLTSIAVVELRGELEAVGREFFGAQDGNFNFVHCEAVEFLTKNHNVYDGIIVDVFSETGLVPDKLLNLEILQKMRRTLNPGGWIAWNLSTRRGRGWRRAMADIVSTLEAAGFPGRVWEGIKGKISSNVIFLHGRSGYKPRVGWKRKWYRLPWRRGVVRSQTRPFQWPDRVL